MKIFEKILGAAMVTLDTLTAVAVMPAYLGGVVVLTVLIGAMAWSAMAKLGV